MYLCFTHATNMLYSTAFSVCKHWGLFAKKNRKKNSQKCT